MLLIFGLISIAIAKDHGECEHSDEPWGHKAFFEWIETEYDVYEYFTTSGMWDNDTTTSYYQMYITYANDTQFSADMDGFKDYLNFHYGPIRDYQSVLCECDGKKKGSCYNVTQYRNVTDQKFENLTRDACNWVAGLSDCDVSNWVYPGPWANCPRCECGSNLTSGEVEWSQYTDQWGGKECFSCTCHGPGDEWWNDANRSYGYEDHSNVPKLFEGYDLPNFTDCGWVSWSPGHINASCPPSTMCENEQADGSWDKYWEGDKLRIRYDWENQNCSIGYCDASSAEITWSDLDSFIAAGNDSVDQVAKQDWKGNLEPCWDDPSQWQAVCDENIGDWWAMSCQCPTNKTAGDSWFMVQEWVDPWYDPEVFDVKEEICYQCTCSSLTDASQSSYTGSEEVTTCEFIKHDIAPVQCDDSLVQCKGEWMGETYTTYCSTCMAVDQMSFPQFLFSDNPRIVARMDCADELLCGVAGIDNGCASANINSTIYRWDDATSKVKEVHIEYTDKIRCCNGALCNQNYNLENDTCTENPTLTKMENFKWGGLFGVNEETKKTAEKIGALESELRETNPTGSGFDMLFTEFSCNDEIVSDFLKVLVRGYCQYVHWAWNSTSDTTVKGYAESQFTRDMNMWKRMAIESGCQFDAECDFATGVGALEMSSETVSFEITMDEEIGNLTQYKMVVRESIGTDVIRSEKQITIEETEESKRRLAESGATYSVQINSFSATAASSIQQSVASSTASTLGGTVDTTTVAAESVEIKQVTTPTAGPTQAPTKATSAPTNGNSTNGNATTTAAVTATGKGSAASSDSNSFIVFKPIIFLISFIFVAL